MANQQQPIIPARPVLVPKPIRLDHRVVKFTAVGLPNFTRALMANSQRQVLVVSCMIIANPGQQTDLSNSSSADDFFASQLSPFVLVLPFSLYGPVIQQEIWCRSLNAGDRINFIETFLLP